LDECIRTANWIAEEVKDFFPDAVVNLGDTFDSHSNIDVPSLCTGVRVMDIIQKACKGCAARFVVIPGNHDAYSMDYSALEAFQNQGLEVVWKPTVYDDVFGAMPYNKNPAMATKWLKELEAKAQVSLIHLDVKQASFFSGHDSDIGIDADDFSGPIYGGHYHHPHDVGPISFVGSVLHHNFTDRVVKERFRGILLLEIDEDGTIRETRKANPHTTIYHKADWTKQRSRLETIKLYGLFEERMHLRVKCDVKKVKQVKEDLRESFPKLISLAVVGVSEETQEVSRAHSVKVDADPEEAMKSYVKNKGVPKGLNKKELLKMGQSLLGSAEVK